jgi:FMN phosphatase YigB (HAD superfamily)
MLIMLPIKGLMIDIDDTLISFKPGNEWRGTGSLMGTLKSAGVELRGFSPDESARRIEQVKKDIRWWSWSHFVEALELDNERFWEYAYEFESKYLGPSEDGIPDLFRGLKRQGLKLFICSNNPNDGIRHKLRLAGFKPSEMDMIFDAILGATGFQQMKWDAEYWRLAIKATKLPKEALAVVGDSFNDDYLIPHSEGIPRTFLVSRNGANKDATGEGLHPVASLGELKGILNATAEDLQPTEGE